MVQVARMFFLASLVGLLLTGCAARGSRSAAAWPVLYPNAAFERVGEDGARDEVAACMARAEAAGLTPQEQDNEAGRRAAAGAATVGATAAVGALLTGRNPVRAGVRGAAVGGTAGAVSGALHERPSMVYRTFVQRCLSEKGFDVIGWN